MKCSQKTPIVIIALLLTSHLANAQKSLDHYLSTAGKADTFYLKQEYKIAIQYYTQAFHEYGNQGKIGHRYRAATSYTKLGMIDSAFSQLRIIAHKGKFSGYDLIISDSNFIPLHEDPRWASVILAIQENKNNKSTFIPDNQ